MARGLVIEDTYTDGIDEVMVRRAGRVVIDVYAYSDAKFLVLCEDGRKIDPDIECSKAAHDLRWKAGQNSLFLHASDPKIAFAYLKANEYIKAGEGGGKT